MAAIAEVVDIGRGQGVAGGDACATVRPEYLKNLEKELKEFSGGLPYDQARVIERTQDGFRQGVHGFYLAGLGLILLHGHDGDTFTYILGQYFPGTTYEAAKKYMRFARAASNLPNFKQFCLERGGYSKGLTMLQSCSEEQIEEFDEKGELLGFTQDQIDGMSVLTLKKALRRAREKEALSVKKAVEKTAAENAELRGQVESLSAQVGIGETPADAAMKRIQAAHEKIFDGIRLLRKVWMAGGDARPTRDARPTGDAGASILTTDKNVREQMIRTCEYAIAILESVAVDATHAGAVEGADY